MRFAEEVVVEEFLPTFRSMLAEDLRDRDLTQRQVATVLGISQSAVSKYAHGDINRREAFVEDDRVRSTVERLGAGLAAGEMSRVEALGEAQALIRRLEDRDRICTIHEREMPALAGKGCDFCIQGPESVLAERERVLSSVRQGIRILENLSGFAGLIPNVGSNMVECRETAATIDDVAAIPGRIFDVKGRTTVPGEPEFGVSEHVATVLLTARAHGSSARAAVNIRYDEAIVDRFRAMGHEVATFPGSASLDAAIEEAIGASPAVGVLAQTGGFGIEPNTYILAEDAPAAAAIVREYLRHDGT